MISRKYGQTPYCPDRNDKRLSITELEFDEAMRLGRPILLFLMSDKHPVTEADIELDPGKRRKLEAFRKRAKRKRVGSEVERVYQVFDSLEQFSAAAAIAVGRLAQHLPATSGDATNATAAATAATAPPADPDPALPHPPALAALQNTSAPTASSAAARNWRRWRTGRTPPIPTRCCCSRRSAGRARACSPGNG